MIHVSNAIALLLLCNVGCINCILKSAPMNVAPCLFERKLWIGQNYTFLQIICSFLEEMSAGR